MKKIYSDKITGTYLVGKVGVQVGEHKLIIG